MTARFLVWIILIMKRVIFGLPFGSEPRYRRQLAGKAEGIHSQACSRGMLCPRVEALRGSNV